MNPQVLIVGAGPTGLVMALALQKQGIPFRIVDKTSGTGKPLERLSSMREHWNITSSLDLQMNWHSGEFPSRNYKFVKMGS